MGYYSNMRSSSREEVVEVFDALEADYKRALDLAFDALTTPERLRVLERCEQLRRDYVSKIPEMTSERFWRGIYAAELANAPQVRPAPIRQSAEASAL